MIKNHVYIPLITVLLFVTISCESVTPEEPLPAVLKGQVVDKATSTPIQGALVQVLSPAPPQEVNTNAQGGWSIELDIDDITTVVLRVTMDGYRQENFELMAAPGREVNAPAMRIEAIPSTDPGEDPGTGQPGTTSGFPHTIKFEASTDTDLAVFNTGGIQQSTITFTVTDSIGRPVTSNRAAQVNFRLGGHPGGGEKLSPVVATTDANGQVHTTLETGTKSGVVQVIADFVNREGRTITSTPVRLVIHSAPPHVDHFSIASESYNLPGRHIFGLTTRITAFIGDRYGNPVEPGTAVYFTTTGGLIQGSGFTGSGESAGITSVVLTTAAPYPVHPVFGPGFATVTARTIDENNENIEQELHVLFSGPPIITTDVTEINVANGGSQTVDFSVSDYWGNPLAMGAQISVKVEGKNVSIDGDVSVTLNYHYLTGGNGVTDFSVTLRDEDDEDPAGNVARLVIEVTGPNGDTRHTINGTTFKTFD